MSFQDWYKKRDVFVFIGLAGVNNHEPKRARSWGQFFSYSIVLVSILLLMQWQHSLTGGLDRTDRMVFNWLIWLFFVFEYVVLLFIVKNKKRFIFENWLIPFIILFGIPFILNMDSLTVTLGTFRPVLAILIIFPSLRLLVHFFIDGRLRTTLLAALIIVVIFGVLVAGVDPGIKTAWDGIWWALATVSTVGYGDVVPTSPLGRIIGAGLVVMGLGIFVVITANFLALSLRKEAQEFKEEEREVRKILGYVEDLKDTQQETILLIKNLQKRLDSIEKKTNSHNQS